MATTNKGLNQPALNAPNWNIPLNDNFGYIDAGFGGVTTIDITGIGTTPVTLTLTQYQNLIINFTGVLTANVTYQVPSGVGGQWIVYNNTSGDYTVSFRNAATGSAVAVIPTDGHRIVYSDGADAYLSDNTTAAIGSIDTVIYNDGTSLTGTDALTFDGNKLAIKATNAAITAPVEVLRINAQSSGIPAAGFGPLMAFASETVVDNTEVVGQIAMVATDVTGGSEDFDFVLKLMAAGLAPAETFRVTSAGTASANIVKATTEMRSPAYKDASGGNTATINGITPIAESMKLLGTINTPTGSGTSVSLASLTLTGYKYLLFEFNGCRASGGGADRRVNDVVVSTTGGGAFYGQVYVSLSNGRAWGGVCADGTTTSIYVGDTGYSTSTNTVTVKTAGSGFNGGSVLVYGVK